MTARFLADVLAELGGERLFNLVEACIWWGIGVFVVMWMFIRRSFALKTLLLALALFAFGATDILETRAWYSPWWLCAWNILCVAAIAFLLFLHIRSKKPRAPVADSDR